MKTDNAEDNWIKSAPTLAKISKSKHFIIPPAYFESLREHLNSLAKLEKYRFETEEEIRIPENYFDLLDEKTEYQLNPLNAERINSKKVFNVPDSYFISLTDRIHSRLPKKDTIVKQNNNFQSWISYAAAASIVFVISISLYLNSSFYLVNNPLSQIPDQDIINYLQIHSTVNDTPYIIDNIEENGLQQVSNDLSEEDIQDYINHTIL